LEYDEFDLEEMMSATMSRNKAHELIDRMPKDSTWDDLIYEIYVRQVVEKGLADSDAGRTKEVVEVRRQYGLSE
jgi:hypothetical protein